MSGRRYRCAWFERTDDPVEWEGNVGRHFYRNVETGEKVRSDRLPFGALFTSDHGPRGYDDLSVVCKIPFGGSRGFVHWYLDSRASNCTMPNDDDHRCWCRHGTIGEIVHVDKVGNTCAAGAGSIAVDGFHGFLHHGELYEC